MSEEYSGATPAPLILDASILIAIARGDTGVITLVQGCDADGQPTVIPALAVTGAALDMRGEEALDLFAGVERLAHAMTAPLAGAEQAARLAEVITRTGLDPWDAHAAAVADAAVCPILTLDGQKWRQHARDLDEPLHIIEIADPDGT